MSPLRYLCLTDRRQLDADIDTWWTRIVGDRTIWGPDLDGWDSGLTLDQNLRARFGNLDDFDAIFLSHSFSSLPQRQEPPSPAIMGNKPTVVFLHEVRSVYQFGPTQPRYAICDLSGIDVVLHAYAESEMDPYYRTRALAPAASRQSQQTIEHLPHHVRTDLFFPPAGGDEARDVDVLLVGRCYPELYPLRARWARLMSEGHWPNAVHLPVPYGIKGRWTADERLDQQNAYAAALRRAHIVLSCSSYWRYMLGKFTEIAASGSFLISDVPTHLPQPFVENMGIVSAEMSDAELVGVVNRWFTDTDARQRRAAALAGYVRQHMDIGAFWTRVDAAVVTWAQARRPS